MLVGCAWLVIGYECLSNAGPRVNMKQIEFEYEWNILGMPAVGCFFFSSFYRI